MSLASLIANLSNFTPTKQHPQQLHSPDDHDSQTSSTLLQHGEGRNTGISNARPAETHVQAMEEEDEIRPPYYRVRSLF